MPASTNGTRASLFESPLIPAQLCYLASGSDFKLSSKHIAVTQWRPSQNRPSCARTALHPNCRSEALVVSLSFLDSSHLLLQDILASRLD